MYTNWGNAMNDVQQSAEQDLYGEMIDAVRRWLSKYHPDATYATVVVHIGCDVPPVSLPVLPSQQL